EFAGAPAYDEAWLDGVDLIAWSPGLSIERGDSASFHARALERGIAVAGELELFAQALVELREGGYRPKVVAVTGTNGKTTTTALAAHLCRAAGMTASAAGNIRPALLDALREALDAQALPEVWVLELSSFQLALAQSFAPEAATILNVSEDHLDWHASMDSYVAAKQRIYAAGSAAVFNRAEPATAPRRAAPPAAVAARRPSAEERRAGIDERRAGTDERRSSADERASREAAAPARVSFGLDEPSSAGDFGLLRDGPLTWLAYAAPIDDELPAARRRKEPPPFLVKRLMPADALRIRGAHNHLNALAALALCTAVGVPLARMLHGLRGYAGEAHRCQLIALIDDVEYYDDSKGTNVGATLAALQGLGKRCRLIAGGDGKGQDFAPLAPAVARHAAAVYLIGRDAPRLREALAETGVPLVDCESLEQAVERAAGEAVLGDAVLLSPACASLDMFRNYEHRAQVFVAAVRELGERRGIIIDGGAAC
ncbi:MAG: Mur ligase family protein, partial [Burkholderiaceae bacterium]